MTTASAFRPQFIAGLDENGLGARLGPMLVTGVLAEADAQGLRFLGRRLSPALARDLDDSKNLLAFKNTSVGEAWARALLPGARTPRDVIESFSSSSEFVLRQRCPKRAERQCWTLGDERFSAEPELVRRMERHLERIAKKGVRIVAVRSEVLCVRQLNDERDAGKNRFISDLHAMERLILEFRRMAGTSIRACCGKVGGMSDYEKYFGPLSGHLRVTLRQTPRESEYRFPSVGDVRFVQDADATNPIVMLASIVGKYLREVLMGRISGFYRAEDEAIPMASGYHDPVTTRLIQESTKIRRRLHVSNGCFERVGNT